MKRHNWIRTFPLDGRWCNRCGLSEADDAGDDCCGAGAAEYVEAKMAARLAAANQRIAELESQIASGSGGTQA